jgi:GH15 family glucan-1,4-alpha-glucosidase
VDWLCLPRFDSASCFSALVGDDRHGRWVVAPAGEVRAVARRYRPGTLVLETDFETDEGTVRVVDFMPLRRDGPPRLMRIVEGLLGRVPVRMTLSVRPDYGTIIPWIEPASDGAIVIAGPDSFRLTASVPLQIEDGDATAEFVAVEGARERLVLTWHLSYEETPPVEDAGSALARTEAWWRDWSGRCSYEGEYRDAVMTSLIALKAMTSKITGAVVAAATTSLPARSSAACAIGITVTAGCATRCLRWRRCSMRGIPTRRWRSGTSCWASGPATRARSRSCTGSAASGG